jgi:hypothetical protein
MQAGARRRNLAARGSAVLFCDGRGRPAEPWPYGVRARTHARSRSATPACACAQELARQAEYFSVDAMRARAPYLHFQLVGEG